MKIFCVLILLVLAQHIQAQIISDSTLVRSTNQKPTADSLNQGIDITDVFRKLSRKKHSLELYQVKKNNFDFTLLPAVGYTLQTGVAILLAASAVWYPDKNDRSKTSTMDGSIAYTQYNQVILPVNANIRTKHYNHITNLRYMSYPSITYGLGPLTNVDDGYDIDFSYLKIHQSLLRRITPDFSAGIGYYYDLLWNQREVNPPSETDFQEYGLHKTETSSGFCFQGLYDTRVNPVNPTRGWYANGRYRLSDQWMGSTTTWQSAIIDVRKYVTFPKKSGNIIALWNYNWVTMGKSPYLMLPSTGWDDYFNTGRGYIQGRFRAKNMAYLEAEYRMRLIKNGLLGAVIYANAQTFSDKLSTQFDKILPGGGAGIRLKLNKSSSANLCIDYAFGTQGSRGLFINLGEVF